MLRIKNITVHRDGAVVSGMSFDVFFGTENLGCGDYWADGSLGGAGPWLEQLDSKSLLRVEKLAEAQGWVFGLKAPKSLVRL